MPIGGRYRGVIFLVLSLVGALAVTFLIYNLIQDAQKSQVTQKPTTNADVVVASVDIPPGWTIKSEHLATRKLPDTYVPDEVYRTPEEVVGRVAMERVLAGEFIREERLADPEAGQGLPAIIPRGMRALQVPVKDSSAVSGFLNPGNFVDVVAVCTESDPPEVRTVMQSVSVLAVNDRMTDMQYQAEAEGGRRARRVAPSVTLALTPEDAERVKYAFSTCRITLTLRNDIDVTNIDSNEADVGADGAGPSAPPSDSSSPFGPNATGFLVPRDIRIHSDGSRSRSPYLAANARG